MEKKLPFNYDTIIKSECWSFYKLGIIQTIPNYKQWLCDKFELLACVDMHGTQTSVVFGDFDYLFGYGTEYYKDILRTKQLAIIPPAQLIEFLKQKVNNGKYMIIPCDIHQVLRGGREPVIHETLIYGYNDEGFYMPKFDFDDRYTFKEVLISFEDVLLAYTGALQHFVNNPRDTFTYKNYFPLIGELTPVVDYLREGWEHIATRRLCMAEQLSSKSSMEKVHYDYTIFRGTWLLKYVFDLVTPRYSYTTLRTLVKISEQISIYCMCLRELLNKLNITDIPKEYQTFLSGEAIAKQCVIKYYMLHSYINRQKHFEQLKQLMQELLQVYANDFYLDLSLIENKLAECYTNEISEVLESEHNK